MLITTQNLGNFNPRSHERSDGRREAEQRETLISIHAPTRGATKARGADNGVTIISIHAPTRGATALVLSLRPLQMYFNPRSHERSDAQRPDAVACATIFQSTLPREERQGTDKGPWLCVTISIHAPTRGATLRLKLLVYLIVFQSTLPREERRSSGYWKEIIYQFQSTLPREERLLFGLL